jgi:hypothetical protein
LEIGKTGLLVRFKHLLSVLTLIAACEGCGKQNPDFLSKIHFSLSYHRFVGLVKLDKRYFIWT